MSHVFMSGEADRDEMICFKYLVCFLFQQRFSCHSCLNSSKAERIIGLGQSSFPRIALF